MATPAAGVCASIFGAAVATASAAPVPFRNFRREIFFFGLDLLMEEYCSAVGARLTRNLEGGAHLNSQFRRIQEFRCAPLPLSHHHRSRAVDLGSGSFERIRNNDNLFARLVPIVLLDGFTNSW